MLLSGTYFRALDELAGERREEQAEVGSRQDEPTRSPDMTMPHYSSSSSMIDSAYKYHARCLHTMTDQFSDFLRNQRHLVRGSHYHETTATAIQGGQGEL